MTIENLQTILKIGETVAVEFKRCGNGIENDTYESVCSFLNRFGGDIFLGVLDDGTVKGLPPKSVSGMIKNFISIISNPNLFSPTVYLEPEIITVDGKVIIHVYVPPSAEVHSYKKVIYDRVDDADVKVTATTQIAAMYIRKQSIFTEKRIYPYLTLDELRTDLLPKIRIMAKNHAMGKHPWEDMDDEQLLRSAGLYGFDHVTGKYGYNLAAVVLLGRDEVIQDIVPTYVTDALVRKVNIDRYDDREIIKTNIIESYELLMEFARKHLPDKFFLEEDRRVSLRNIITREMLVNTLIHREFTSSFIAKFVIEETKMYVENANRAVREGIVTPENMEPNPKNPIIASFFRNIGYSDQLGSGVRNLFKYTKYYSNDNPQLVEGDVFRIIVPLDENYSFDQSISATNTIANPEKTIANPEKTIANPEKTIANPEKTIAKSEKTIANPEKTIANIISSLPKSQQNIIREIIRNPGITQKELASQLSLSIVGIRYAMKVLKTKGILYREGSQRKGIWKIIEK